VGSTSGAGLMAGALLALGVPLAAGARAA
jgi:hypothetical protein